MALNWAFVFQFMTWDAGFMGERFTPAVNLSGFGLVAIETFNIPSRLMFPMLKREYHDPHLEIDNIRAAVFGWIILLCCKDKCAGENKCKEKGYAHCQESIH